MAPIAGSGGADATRTVVAEERGRARLAVAGRHARRRPPSPAERGQATVEVVGLLPLLVAIVLGAAQLLAAGLAHELADQAAEAGAVAALEGADPAGAARRAVPTWARDDLSVHAGADRITVALPPPAPFPALAAALTAHATAATGPVR